MGQVVPLAEVEARRLRARAAGRGAADAPARPMPAFEAVDCGSGWYHGEAIRAAQASPPEPR